MISLCRYILQGGNQCQQAAINGEYYCRHHLVVRRTVKAATSTRPDPYRVDKSLPLVFPDDRAAHQLNVFMVMQAFNTGEISPRSAKVFALLLHECGVNLKKGALYDTNHENAVRSVEVTPEGEEIGPAREVPETGLRAQGSGLREEIPSASEVPETGLRAQGSGLSEEILPASETREEENEAVSTEAVSGEASEEAMSEAVASGEPASDKAQKPDSADSWSPSDFACNDPCYIANLTERREQYRAFALNDLAAGRDPRAWEDFIPGKSRMRRPKRHYASVALAAK